MSKKWYEYFVTVEGDSERAPTGGSNNDAASAIEQIAASMKPTASPLAPSPTIPQSRPMAATPPPTAAKFEKSDPLSSFEDIYKAAEIQTPPHGYSIMKVAEMLNSEHIRHLPAEVKKGSILVALEAAGVKIQDVIQDAIRRDQALDGFERVRQKSVEDIEARKLEENRKIQADLDKYIAEQNARLQANLEEVSKQKEQFASWRIQKQLEEQKIADCVAYFVADNPISTASNPRPGAAPEKS
jgi:hypothetical protein